jgi:hypothetical protein
MAESETVVESLKRIQSECGMSDVQMAALVHVQVEKYIEWMQLYDQKIHTAVIPLGMDSALPLISIFNSLFRRFSSAQEVIQWLFKENQHFGGNKPIDVATSSVENLYWLSYYLDLKPTFPRSSLRNCINSHRCRPEESNYS